MSEKIESYFVKNKLYVSTKFLTAYFNRSDKQIGRWKKDGLPEAVKPKEINERGNYYILEDVIAWIDKNINQSKSSNSSRDKNPDDINIEDEEKLFEIYTTGTSQQKRKLLLRLNQNRLDNFKKIEDIVEKEAKNKEYDSKYALVDNVKKGQQELASIFVSILKNSMPVLSKTLENKNQNEIYHALDTHFKKEVSRIVKYINKNEDTIITLSEVINYIVYLVSTEDMSQSTILKKLKELEE